MENKAFLQFELCGRERTIESNPVRVREFEIEFEKFGPECEHIVSGETVEFRFRLENKSEVNLNNVIFRDPLPRGLEYVPHSFRINGHPARPEVHRGTVEFCIAHFNAGIEMNISFETRFGHREHHRPRPPRV